jgi:hypothetical protein
MLKPHRARPVCLWCDRRPALARVRGTWRVVKHHDVCRQCWRSFMDACAAERLAHDERMMAAHNSRHPRRFERGAPRRGLAA